MFELIKEIKENKHQEISEQLFFVSEKRFLDTRNGDKYIGLKLKDKSGVIDAKIWKNFYHLHENFKEGDFVKLKAKVDCYKDNWQLIIESIEKIEADDNLKDELLPKTQKDIEVLVKDFFTIIDTIQNPEIRKLLLDIFGDKDLFAKFKRSPAGKIMHHAYIGGLIEHTVSVAKICNEISNLYTPIDNDILLASALLHDIGKIYELDSSTFNYTTEGQLIGHIAIGYNLVKEKMKEVILPFEQEIQILHCILSHHGKLEYGSPVLPKTKEALLLHLADMIDSSTQPLQDLQTNETNETDKTNWSNTIKILGRSFFMPNNKTNDFSVF